MNGRLRILGLVLALCAIAFLATPALARTRTYFIASDEVLWRYAPSGRDELSGAPLHAVPLQLGWDYRKIIYRAYTDASFHKLAPRSPQDAYLGMLGPVMRAEVGDTLVVHFKNNATIPTSLVPDGIDAPAVASLRPGATATYEWTVPQSAGPAPDDPSSIAWLYFSTTAAVQDENTGMFGPLIVARKGSARVDGSPSDVDREIVVMFAQIDESASRLLGANIADPSVNPRHVEPRPPFPFHLQNSMFTINGFLYGNMPMVSMRQGTRVRWYVMSTRSDYDVHLPHWHGQTVLQNGMRTDVVRVEENSSVVADMVPDNPGVWLFHCHLAPHLEGGMEARFRVIP